MSDHERQRMLRDLSGQGVVYAIALIAVVLLITWMEVGSGTDTDPPPPASPAENPPLFPSSR